MLSVFVVFMYSVLSLNIVCFFVVCSACLVVVVCDLFFVPRKLVSVVAFCFFCFHCVLSVVP